MDAQVILLRLAVAALGGLAVGIEREWSARRESDHTRFGGVRTFLLLGLLGGLAAVFLDIDARLGAIVLAAGAALILAAYLASAWRGTIDATTEVAGVVVLAAGALAGGGRLAVASAVFAGTALVLVEKSRMHAAVERLQSAELEAGARFAVLALVVLPLLPAGPLEALGGVEPRKLWALVLLFAGLSFAGFVALRIAGPERGWGVAGLLGGVVSSTAVTLNFARESRAAGPAGAALGLGALAASTIMPLRVLVLSAVLDAEVALALAVTVVPALVLGAVAVAFALRRTSGQATTESALPKNPMRLGIAVQMALLFAFVLWLLDAVSQRFGASGVLGGAALLGLTDLDALTYSVNQLAADGLATGAAVRALLVGMLANTLFKGVLAVGIGTGAFRRIAGLGLAAFALAFGAGLLLVARS